MDALLQVVIVLGSVIPAVLGTRYIYSRKNKNVTKSDTPVTGDSNIVANAVTGNNNNIVGNMTVKDSSNDILISFEAQELLCHFVEKGPNSMWEPSDDEIKIMKELDNFGFVKKRTVFRYVLTPNGKQYGMNLLNKRAVQDKKK